MYRSLLQSLLTLGMLAVVGIVLAACAGVNDSGTHPDFVETQAASQPSEEGGHGGEEASPEASPGATETGGGGEDLAATGQQLATTNGCTGCHSIDGAAGVGPTWQGLFGHEVKLSDGSTVTADEAYLTESIHDPGAKVVEGFQNIMPQTYAEMPDDQVNAIIAYIQSLD